MIKKIRKKLSSFFSFISSSFSSGLSLVEVIIALSVGAVLIVGSSGTIALILKNNLWAKNNLTAGFLAQELIDNLKVISKSDWNAIYNIPIKGPDSQYHMNVAREVISGTEVIIVENRDFVRYFSAENVYRTACGTGDITKESAGICVNGIGILEDNSTQRIVISVSWAGEVGSISTTRYLTRHYDAVFVQTDWSDGIILDEKVISPNKKFSASTNIDFTSNPGSIVLSAGSTEGTLISSIFDTQRINGAAFNSVLWQGDLGDGTVRFQIATLGDVQCYAWNDYVGWINFCHLPGRVTVEDTLLTGFAYNDDIQEIALDCATSPAGDICLNSNFRVFHNSITGDLSGWAWSDVVGWISFNCLDPNVCAISDYRVNIDPITGEFTGWAWNEHIGWISFNCNNSGIGDTCAISDYRVQIIEAATWNFVGNENSITSYYGPINNDFSTPIIPSFHNNYRYVRYKIFLTKTTASPRIDDIIINWSP